ncbi:HK97 family phage prohead protease [Testudinibacter sp. TR-2022]|uniref:HK97 family phage prohead protease n=1 Tax=Testudinibacter sp. TR-2022 TaxID=2585029 RepID=UPI00111857C4|nr:HK97 family phage prohead protease [Testudinibacter sp. TR-2022]TNH06636.1 HK97 family phage prohead protease [Pasteurellaceae bacterium Phil11]TNH25527.1 HK97 family phage prohead protease [Testudinibacter sp. TR-2022]TNH25695.1 HK97 family phage prohead protease [Testudinibacter sp. TR-2022]
MTLKTKDLHFKAEAVQEDGVFSGYCNVFDLKDSYGDIVRKGAFAQTLLDWAGKGKMPPVLWNHDRNQPIGVWTSLKEDDHGLYGEGKLLINDVARAKEVHALLKAGAIDGLSIGYFLNKWTYDEKEDTLEILDVDLKEVSVVTYPANVESTVSNVKTALLHGELPTLSEFEKFLREAGFSKTQATAIAGHGLRKLLRGEPEKTEVDTALTILKSINTGE